MTKPKPQIIEMKYFCCVESLYSLASASGDQWDIISLLMQALLPQSNAYHGRTIFNINFLTDLLSIIYLKNWGRLH